GDLGALAYEVRDPVRPFEDEVRDLCHLIEGHAGDAPLELHSRAKLRESLRCPGLHHRSSFAREASLEISHELHLPERGTVMLGEFPAALPHALGETELDEELKPPEHLESHLLGEREGGTAAS